MEFKWDLGWDLGFGIGMGLWQMGWDDGIWDGSWDSPISINMGGKYTCKYPYFKTWSSPNLRYKI